MDGISPIFAAGLTGFLSGLLLSIPVGPVNLTIMNEGARHGFLRAMLIGFGASAMEVVYCAIAFTGFASLFHNRVVRDSMEIFSLLFMLYLGIKFLRAKTVEAPAHLGRTADKIEERLGEKFHPHSAFMVGFVRTMANPGVLLFWIILAANFISREWVRPDWPGKSACVGGVALGTGLWFFVLSFGSSRGHGRLGEKTLLRMEHFSGICLLVVAVVHGGQIGWQIARHKF